MNNHEIKVEHKSWHLPTVCPPIVSRSASPPQISRLVFVPAGEVTKYEYCGYCTLCLKSPRTLCLIWFSWIEYYQFAAANCRSRFLLMNQSSIYFRVPYTVLFSTRCAVCRPPLNRSASDPSLCHPRRPARTPEERASTKWRLAASSFRCRDEDIPERTLAPLRKALR